MTNMSKEKSMSEELDDLQKQVEEIPLEELEDITIEEVRASRPKIFGEDSFTFVLGEIRKAKVRRNVKTSKGFGDMYILHTMNPKIYTFGNGYDQLTKFVEANNLKKGDTIKYIRNYIPEGKDTFDTTYVFEKVK